MADSTYDRGSKPPRTMFSLGRPGSRKHDGEPEGAPVDEAVDEVDSSLLVDSGYLCGACDAPLPVGAAYCGQCATPVAGMVPDTAFDGDDLAHVEELDELEDRSPLTDLEVPDDAATVEPAVPADGWVEPAAEPTWNQVDVA